MPSPITSASRIAHASPVPAQTWFGSDGATASAPIACAGCLSKTGENVLPSSVDFHTPPDAAPTYQMRTSPGTPVIDATRPPNDGPIIWNCKRRRHLPASAAAASLREHERRNQRERDESAQDDMNEPVATMGNRRHK